MKFLRDLLAEKEASPRTLAQQAVEERFLDVLGTGMEELIEHKILLLGRNEKVARSLRTIFETEIRTKMQ